jgi:hypothetical protein
VRAAEDGSRRTAREEAVTGGVGAAKANGRRARRRGMAAGAADEWLRRVWYVTHPESGRRPLSSLTRELGRQSGVTDRGIDPEFCDYGTQPWRNNQRTEPHILVPECN